MFRNIYTIGITINGEYIYIQVTNYDNIVGDFIKIYTLFISLIGDMSSYTSFPLLLLCFSLSFLVFLILFCFIFGYIFFVFLIRSFDVQISAGAFFVILRYFQCLICPISSISISIIICSIEFAVIFVFFVFINTTCINIVISSVAVVS